MSMVVQTPNSAVAEESQNTGIGTEVQQKQSRGWRFWLVFPGLCFAMLLAALDTSVVATALPTIIEQLNSGSLYIWMINGYFVGIAAVQPMYGQAADIFGRRWPMILSVSLFSLGSGLCGGANSTVMLIVARIIQGFGAGGIFSLVSIIVADLVPLRERQKFMSIIQSFFALGSFIGPVIGGVIVTHTSWRWVFYINLPIGGVSLVMLFVFLKMKHRRIGTVTERLRRVDFPGHAILIASVVSILIPLTWGGTTYDWSSYHVLVPLLLGFAGLFLFGGYEVLLAKELASIPSRLFGNPVSIIGYLMTFFHGICMAWLSFFLPLYFQVLLEVSPEMSGVYLLATVISLMPAGIAGGWFIAMTGRYKPALLLGWCLFALGAGLLTLLDSKSSPARWIIFQIISGLGGGIILTTTIPAIQASLPEKDVALATATWSFIRSLGTIWGGAIPAAIFNSRFDSLLNRIDNPAVRTLLSSGGAYEHATANFIQGFNGDLELKGQVIQVYTESSRRVWQILIAFTLVAVPLALAIKEIELRKTLETEFGLEQPKSADAGTEAVGVVFSGAREKEYGCNTVSSSSSK
ncbi:Efflux pump FUS6 [Lachnellula suecica]|uniref:Efflux pump FUS6 n=1 Tax=Lachnellula suecica TaxID=602035 RepID=A0A8T9CD97_9HELO|nr:Efflux pump FUS6 [Lachnellula suecica]